MTPKRSSSRNKYRIMVPVLGYEHALSMLHLAGALLRDRPGEIVVVGAVEVPPERSLTEGTAQARVRRREVNDIVAARPDLPIRTKPRVRVSHLAWSDLEPIVQAESIDLLLVPWSGAPGERVLGLSIDELLKAAPCDVVLVPADKLTTARLILLPMRGGPHAARSLQVALDLADANQAEITLLHAAEQEPEALIGERFVDFSPFLRSLVRVTRKKIEAAQDAVAAIRQEAPQHDVVIMGATARSAPATSLGPITGTVARQVATPLIVVRARQPTPGPPELAPGWEPVRPTVVTPLSIVVDKWFAENTFDSDEFADLDRLVEAKQQQGVTISLGLPSLNEEETVGQVIETVQQALVVRHPLLDEIALIDSGSTDRTVEIARSLGVPIYVHQDILPQYKTYAGKGDALWKSLYVLNGDIIAWIDTDIKNIQPYFVFGLIGPLLRRKRIQYVKGFYRRPIRVGKKLRASGGGRVTELVARPLFNLFFPELSGLAQPLAGEYAGRRSALEQLPFFTGYGVETGLLIDLLDKFGLQAIAQVDLKERIHRNQPLGSLSRMSFAIMQVVMARLEDRHKVQLLAEINRTMKLIRRSGDWFHLEEERIGDFERLPMATIPEYRKKFMLKEMTTDLQEVSR
jgi:nucleotide-binding universal stress UspA family protein